MFDFLRKKIKPEKTLSESDRVWMNLELSTMSAMKSLYSDRCNFATLAGAVFALHQDHLLAYKVDLRKTNDVVAGIALDRTNPSSKGDFATRVGLSFDALIGIDDVNVEAAKEGRIAGLDDNDHRLVVLLAQMRSIAARIWLLTMGSKVKGGERHRLGVLTMWMMLQVVRPEELVDFAKVFSGTYYKNVRCESMNPNHWPQSS